MVAGVINLRPRIASETVSGQRRILPRSRSSSAPAASSRPTGLYASSIAGNVVTLRWNSFPSLFLWGPNVGYVVEGGLNPGEVLASVKTGSTLPVLTFVAPTGAFYVRAHVLVGNIKTAPSNEIRIFVNVPAAPSPPDRLLSHVDGTDLTLAWRNIQNGGQATAL